MAHSTANKTHSERMPIFDYRERHDSGSVRQSGYKAPPPPSMLQRCKAFLLTVTRVLGGLSSYWVAESAALILVPGAVFMLVMALFEFSYDTVPWLGWLVFFSFATISIYFLMAWFSGERSGAKRMPKSYVILGVLSMTAACLGLILGFYGQYVYVLDYMFYKDGRSYNNVDPSGLAAGTKDAAVLSFAGNALIDTSRAVGFSREDTFCVAPIVTRGASVTSAGYWAAGLNCCKERGSFECDDALTTSAHGGHVLRAGSGGAREPLETYMKAVEQASAVYGISVPAEPTFVRWLVNVPEATSSLMSSASEFYWETVLVVYLCSGVFGACIVVLQLLKDKHYI